MFNLEINGIGQSGGGTFGDVSIEGIGRVSSLRSQVLVFQKRLSVSSSSSLKEP